MTRASKLFALVCFSWLGLFNTACQDNGGCEDIQDEYKCMARSDCMVYGFVPFVRGDGGRFECIYQDHLSVCVKRHSAPMLEEQRCTTVHDQEFIVAHWYLNVEMYPCEGHENQYGGCINDDVCAYCGNGRQDHCELCDGDLYEPRPCEWELDQGYTGGMITRCNATCDGYDTSDCTTG